MRLAKAKGRFLNTNVKVPRATLQSSYWESWEVVRVGEASSSWSCVKPAVVRGRRLSTEAEGFTCGV